MNPLLFFFQSASAGGVLLFLAAILGLVMANTGLAPYYEHFLHAELGPLPVHLWINDVLMAIFFLQVGLEVKREMIHGELNTNAKRFLPGIGAFFGLICPAIVYTIVNFSYPEYLSGWAIPTATDIAFAIGIVSVLGSRVPISMKVFLTTLAVMDDLMAIVIIALFYTQELAWMYLLGAAAVTALLFYINRIGYIRPIPYLMLGIVLWYCVFRSGLHATLAGVILASAIPFRGMREGRTVSRYRNGSMPSRTGSLSSSCPFSDLRIPVFISVISRSRICSSPWSLASPSDYSWASRSESSGQCIS